MNTEERFYELTLSDCDGANATAHVWTDGRIDRVAGSVGVFRRLVRLRMWDSDAPGWVIKALIQRYPALFRAS